MASPLIATKLSVPKLRRGLVERPRLSERLRHGAESKLTLISAPAGFGKTTLLAEWLAAAASDDRAVAWLSLDQADNDPASFWSHVIDALQAAAAGIGASVLPMSPSGQPSKEIVLATLLNELNALNKDIDLVLDDYHVIDQPEIEAGLAFLLEHLPAHVHVVIGTRADPALPLARLRARGELVEVRSADLRFTAGEASAYLNEVMGLGLTAKDTAALEERTEGWIAALQLAVLSLQGRDDATAFIAGFAGSDRYIVDYLVEEVLQRQSDEVRRFLSRTCFLGRLSGSLCDAVTGASGSKGMLEALDRQNLFVIPLDDRRQWYRYHHLFADVLMAHLSDDERAELPALHRRASDWLERHGERAEAIDHALAGEDWDRAVRLIELALPEARRSRRERLLRDWLKALPDALIRARPLLGVGLVGVLAAAGQLDEVEDRLSDAEKGLAAMKRAGTGSEAGIDVATELGRLPGTIELYRAALAQVRGDVPATVSHANRVLELAPEDDQMTRAGAAGFLGIAFWTRGDLEAARGAWRECMNGLLRAGHLADALGTAVALAEINLAQGHLAAAIDVCEQALRLAPEQGGYALPGTADVHVGLSRLYLERNDLEAATRHLSRSEALGELAGLPQHPYRRRVALAQMRLAESDPHGALALIEEAEKLHVSDFFPNVRPLAAMKARIRMAQGQLGEASRWARDGGVAADDELSYLRECEHLTLARLLIAQHGADPAGSLLTDALGLLDRLLAAAERGVRMGSVIEIAVLQAIALRARGDIAAALVPLQRALTLAEPEGHVRVFVDEGEAMAALLKLAVKRGIAPAYARGLLAAFGAPERRPGPATHPDLIEPLSERELDVLRLLRSDLDGPDIARELMISLNTMRTHTKAIYEKLGVNTRRAAVRRAEELSLLQRSPPR